MCEMNLRRNSTVIQSFDRKVCTNVVKIICNENFSRIFNPPSLNKTFIPLPFLPPVLPQCLTLISGNAIKHGKAELIKTIKQGQLISTEVQQNSRI